MNQRHAPDEIIHGVQTTSDKIRALACAGYDRTEISEILSIRYQHARNRDAVLGPCRRLAA